MKQISIFIVTIAIFLMFLPHLLSAYAEIFSKEILLRDADAIVILSGNPKTRANRAIELFESRVSDKIYITQTPKNVHIFQKNMVKKIMQVKNINFFVIPSLKKGATSTYDEAKDVAIYAKKLDWKKIVIVTDEFHSARAYYAFKKIFNILDSKIQIGISTAKNNIFNVNNWWESDAGISAYILEALKFMVYFFKSSNLEFIEQV